MTVGKRADIALINTRTLGMFPVNDPIELVVRSTTPADVDMVIADGQLLERNDRLLDIYVGRLASSAAAGTETLLLS